MRRSKHATASGIDSNSVRRFKRQTSSGSRRRLESEQRSPRNAQQRWCARQRCRRASSRLVSRSWSSATRSRERDRVTRSARMCATCITRCRGPVGRRAAAQGARVAARHTDQDVIRRVTPSARAATRGAAVGSTRADQLHCRRRPWPAAKERGPLAEIRNEVRNSIQLVQDEAQRDVIEDVNRVCRGIEVADNKLVVAIRIGLSIRCTDPVLVDAVQSAHRRGDGRESDHVVEASG